MLSLRNPRRTPLWGFLFVRFPNLSAAIIADRTILPDVCSSHWGIPSYAVR
jgi:hypothetical protein